MTYGPRTFSLAVAALALFASAGWGQRGSRGTMSVPRATTTPPARSPSASPPRTSMPPSRGGYITAPGIGSNSRARPGDLPRMVTQPPRRPRGYARTYAPSFPDRGSRYWGTPITRRRFGSGCVYGCSGVRASVRVGPFSGSYSRSYSSSFVVGYPLFAVPVFVPYYVDADYDRYAEPRDDAHAAEPSRSTSKLIVIGTGSAGGGDALTVETLGDSVRLNWLANGRPAREVKLFVADSARRELATRSASPSAPSATFEVSTLSAPVAFAGVSVVFSDGVTSTTLVPYRGDVPARERR